MIRYLFHVAMWTHCTLLQQYEMTRSGPYHVNMLFYSSPCWCCTCDAWGWWWRGDTGWYPIGCCTRASAFIQWDADPLKVPIQPRRGPLCVCVCVCEGWRGRCVWRVRRLTKALDWPVEEGGANTLLHNTKPPYEAASLSPSWTVCLPLSRYLWHANFLNSFTYFSQYSVHTVFMFVLMMSNQTALSLRLLGWSSEASRLLGKKTKNWTRHTVL